MNYLLYFVLMSLLIGSVFAYGKIRSKFLGYRDPLGVKINKYMDGWVITHFLAFMVAGIIFPETFYLTMTLGIVWEIFESWAGKTKPIFLRGIGDSRTVGQSTKRYWWYGQVDDIIADFLGFMVGKLVIRKYIF